MKSALVFILIFYTSNLQCHNSNEEVVTILTKKITNTDTLDPLFVPNCDTFFIQAANINPINDLDRAVDQMEGIEKLRIKPKRRKRGKNKIKFTALKKVNKG